MISALIFDVDGTLADTERDGHRVAFNRAFEQAGLDWQWDVELYGKLLAVTGGKERIQFYLDSFRRDFTRPQDMTGFLKTLHQSKTRYYLEMLEAGEIPMRPGVARLLRDAQAQGIRLAIATTTTPENVTTLLQHALDKDAVSWFEVIGAGDIVPAKKPAPDIYHWVLREMGLSPAQALAVEDSENGWLSARQAGLQALITLNHYTQDQRFEGALAVVDHLGEPDQPCTLLASAKLVPAPRVVDMAWLRNLFGNSN